MTFHTAKHSQNYLHLSGRWKLTRIKIFWPKCSSASGVHSGNSTSSSESFSCWLELTIFRCLEKAGKLRCCSVWCKALKNHIEACFSRIMPRRFCCTGEGRWISWDKRRFIVKAVKGTTNENYLNWLPRLNFGLCKALRVFRTIFSWNHWFYWSNSARIWTVWGNSRKWFWNCPLTC